MTADPIVGAIVHYVSRGSADSKFAPTIVTAIGNNTNDLWLDLAVINPTGIFFDHAVPRSLGADQPEDVFPGYTIATCHDARFYPGGTWHWPTTHDPGPADSGAHTRGT